MLKPSLQASNLAPTAGWTLSSSTCFQFFPLRFEFVAEDPLCFPPLKASNMLRGAMGAIFQRIPGVPECLARVFKPAVSGPSGLSDPPRPFVFRARHLDGRSFQPGELFHFDLHVFSLDPEVLAYLVRAFAAVVRDGLGNQRSKAELQRVLRLSFNHLPERTISADPTQISIEPAALDLTPLSSAPGKIRVEFLSPTELKHNQQITGRPEFPILFGRIRDRIGTLSALYGPGPLAIDFREIGSRAAAVRMINCEVHRQEIERRSTRTGQIHSIGGFVGFAEYEGEMTEFLPYLEAARWVGVGRHAVWGKGEIAVTGFPLPVTAAP